MYIIKEMLVGTDNDINRRRAPRAATYNILQGNDGTNWPQQTTYL